MNLTKEQADKILRIIGFAEDQGQLEHSPIILNLLEDIAITWPNLFEHNLFLYLEVANKTWYNHLPRFHRSNYWSNYPRRPANWWSPDKELIGLPRERKRVA